MPFHYSSDFRPQICERMQTSKFRSFARRSSASAHMAIRGFNCAWRKPSTVSSAADHTLMQGCWPHCRAPITSTSRGGALKAR